MTCSLIAFDLDDTLYKEIDYLRSAYREITRYAMSRAGERGRMVAGMENGAYAEMMRTYHSGGNAFQRLNEVLGLDIPTGDYLRIYRTHHPDIRLGEDVVSVLDALKAQGHILGLITDGRSLQQRNKIVALGLDRWIAHTDIVISEEFGSEKPAEANYRHFMLRYPECRKFVYVGDNPQKDFIAPNRLGWQTICLEDDGRNIHRQHFDEVPRKAKPGQVCLSMKDVAMAILSREL